MKNKSISIFLSFVVFLHSFVVPVAVFAQEATPTPQPVVEEQVESSPSPSETPIATVENSPTPEPIVTPLPTPNHPPFGTDEYEEWEKQKDEQKLLKNIEDDLREAREDEWKAHKDDPVWIEKHGGNKENYVSGIWQPEPEATATPTPLVVSEEVLGSQDQLPFESPDPFCVVDPFALEAEQTQSSVSNQNCATTTSSSDTSAISGQNTASQNDGSASVTTGEAIGSDQMTNSTNTNVTNPSVAGNNTNGDGEGFGQSSEATLSVTNSNVVVAENQMNVEGVSGENNITENDGDVVLTTGDVELIANMLNILNLNIVGDDFMHLIVNIFGQLNGNLDLESIAKALGYQDEEALEVLAKADESDQEGEPLEELAVDNNNTAIVNNEINISGVSGQNDVLGNDGEAQVITGRVTLMANLLNFINSNFSGDKWKFIMVNIFGGLNGDIVVPETQQFLGTSGDSAQASNTESINSNVANSNNVELTNNINAEAISGNNEQVGNDDGQHNVQSGNTNVSSNILNFLNLNISGDNWVFLIVNVFGKWMGQIVGFGGSETIAAPENGTFAALATGENHEEESDSKESSTQINNNNQAVVNNTINASGVSGENSVNKNDGVTNIKTGWVEVDANLLNIINTNVTGRNWMIVFLNVFGNFMGDLFFGAPPAPVEPTLVAQEQSGAIGGPSELDSNNSNNSNSSNSNSDSQGTSGVPTPSSSPKPKTKFVTLTVLGDSEVVEDDSTYQAEYLEVPSIEPQIVHEEGIFQKLLGFLKNLYYTVRGIIDPIFAQVLNFSPLS